MANGDYAVTNTGTDGHNSRLPDSVVVRIVAEVVNRLGYRPWRGRPEAHRMLTEAAPATATKAQRRFNGDGHRSLTAWAHTASQAFTAPGGPVRL